jgi:hypothetical protein
MADGGRAGRRKEQFSDADAEQLERAAKRLARAFGYGNSWATSSHEVPESETWGDSTTVLSIAHRGYITEQAARSIAGCRHVRRQHAWAIHGGVVAVPVVSPDPMAQAALSCAQLREPLEPLLLAYALESMPHWLEVEPYLHTTRPSRHAVIAGRDAMSRIMFAAAATPIDLRARDLHVRATEYRNETRGAEYVLRGWLVRAASMYNRIGDAHSAPLGRSQGIGFRVSSLWNQREYEATRNRDGGAPRKRHKK